MFTSKCYLQDFFVGFADESAATFDVGLMLLLLSKEIQVKLNIAGVVICIIYS